MFKEINESCKRSHKLMTRFGLRKAECYNNQNVLWFMKFVFQFLCISTCVIEAMMGIWDSMETFFFGERKNWQGWWYSHGQLLLLLHKMTRLEITCVDFCQMGLFLHIFGYIAHKSRGLFKYVQRLVIILLTYATVFYFPTKCIARKLLHTLGGCWTRFASVTLSLIKQDFCSKSKTFQWNYKPHTQVLMHKIFAYGFSKQPVIFSYSSSLDYIAYAVHRVVNCGLQNHC